jgi:hypothetical protein
MGARTFFSLSARVRCKNDDSLGPRSSRVFGPFGFSDSRSALFWRQNLLQGAFGAVAAAEALARDHHRVRRAIGERRSGQRRCWRRHPLSRSQKGVGWSRDPIR